MSTKTLVGIAFVFLNACIFDEPEERKTVFLHGDTTQVSHKGVDGSPVTDGEMTTCEFWSWMQKNLVVGCCIEGVAYWTEINGKAYRIDTVFYYAEGNPADVPLPVIVECRDLFPNMDTTWRYYQATVKKDTLILPNPGLKFSISSDSNICDLSKSVEYETFDVGQYRFRVFTDRSIAYRTDILNYKRKEGEDFFGCPVSP